jgi:hypothetical protein
MLPVWTPGGAAADASEACPRRNTEGAKEWSCQRDHYAGRDPRGLGRKVDRDDAPEDAGELVRQGARVGALEVVAVADREIDLLDADLQHVTRHGAVDKNRPAQDVRPGAPVLHLAVDGAGVLRDHARRDGARTVDLLGVDLGCGFDGDDVPGIDRQYRLERGTEVPDVHCLRAWHQRVLGCTGAFCSEAE